MSNLSSEISKLRTWRENNARNSREIVDTWLNISQLIGRNLDKLGKEKFLILEQVCLASLDCYRHDISHHCIKQLLHEFPNSLRVKVLRAMQSEAIVSQDFNVALDTLESIIKADQTNSAARKRKVAILKAQGKPTEAIKELAEYLKMFMADFEAWQELSELYIAEQDFSKAAFCVEELILHNPHNHLLHQRYADIKYTQGGAENFELARAYYCQALKLNPNNMRALYGVYLSSSNIASSQKCSAPKKKEASKLADWAFGEIKKMYENVAERNANIEERLASLQIN